MDPAAFEQWQQQILGQLMAQGILRTWGCAAERASYYQLSAVHLVRVSDHPGAYPPETGVRLLDLVFDRGSERSLEGFLLEARASRMARRDPPLLGQASN